MRTRMTAAFTLFIGLFLLLASAGIIGYQNYSSKQHTDAVLRQTAQRISQEWDSGDRDLDEVTEDAGEVQGEKLAIVVRDSRGGVLRQTAGRVPPWPLPHDDTWRAAVAPAGADIVVVALPWRRIERAFRVQSLMLLLFSVLVIAVTAAGGWLLVGRTLSPIGLLSRQAQAASVDSLRLGLTAPSQDVEVVELVTTLNGLLDRVAQTAAAKGRFYAAASHELRTPLQALSGHLEVALSRPRRSEEYQVVLNEAYAQTRRLIALVESLLLLNRLDTAGAPPVTVERTDLVDLADICERALAQYRSLMEERGLRLVTELPDTVEIAAPLQHVDILVRNIIENAVKYASTGGEVRVKLSADGGRSMHRHAILEIFNECPPVAGWEGDKYFEPFFRPDSSRTVGTGGNGLGLAICKALALANGWSLSLEQTAGGVLVCVDMENIKNAKARRDGAGL